VMLPAVGQGALGLEAREDDPATGSRRRRPSPTGRNRAQPRRRSAPRGRRRRPACIGSGSWPSRCRRVAGSRSGNSHRLIASLSVG
jgi:hypothetical protein